MNKYKIYSTNDGIHVAVKVGWSWTGFFLIMCIYAFIMGVIGIFSSSLFTSNKEHVTCILIVGITALLLATLYGTKSNEIKEKELRGKKYFFRGIISGKNEGTAVYNYITKSNKLKNKVLHKP